MLGKGSTINWDNVNETNYTNSQAYKRANTAYNNASTAQTTANDAHDLADDAYVYADDAYGLASGASTKVSNLSKDFLALINGTYESPKSTFIDGTTIKSPTIEAGTMNSVNINSANLYSANIHGANYYDVNKIGRLLLSSDNNKYSDLSYLRVKDNKKLFGITDGGDNTASLWLYGRSIGYGSANAFFPSGTWNFAGATVTNLNVPAKFG